ncbi:ankyrin repeat-containing domain protein [Mycena epipterygia]|nr:ankyrin repeat-containing domain protein [Mycena epipterygia]
MAEVLGTLGSIATIIQLIDMALKAREYIKDFHKAPGEQQKMFAEIDHLRPLLMELQNRVLASPSTSSLHHMEGPLQRFETLMKDFTAKFELPDGRWSKFSKQLTWTLWNKKEAKEYLNEFEGIKSLLHMWVTVHLSENYDRAEHKRILNWITPLNFFQRQVDIFSTWQAGTGEWLLSDAQFKDWESGSEKVLWCRGIPGAGKTVLSSMVVNHLRVKCPKDTGVACIYLNYKETEIQTAVNLLAGLWKQLAVDKALSPAVHILYKAHHQRDTRPSLDEVFNLLEAVIAQCSRTYLIVDALDEYPEDKQYILLKYLALILGPTTNIMITSRPHVTLDPFLLNAQMIDVCATEHDIRRYVDIHILQSPRLSRHIKTRPELQEEICSKIISNVEGMFLLAKLHIESLATKNTVKAVRDTLQHLPKDLDQTYDEAMERINCQNEDDKQLGKLALTWVAYAKRPLSVAELREAIAIDHDTSTLDVDELLDINTILSVSAGLIIVDEAMSIVRLIHYTTQHYFEKIQMTEFTSAHSDIASKCFTYLSFSEFSHLQFKGFEQQDTIRALVGKHPLLAYSQYCLIHTAKDPGLRLLAQIESFLRKSTSWKEFWYWNTESTAAPWNYGDWPSLPSLLFISAISNLMKITEHILIQGTYVQADSSPLCAAAFYGHLEIVNLLLKFGVDPNARGRYSTALQISAYRGHESMVRLLIEKGAEVNAQGGNALQAAAWQGFEPMVRLLIDKGAEMNAQGHIVNALQAAAYEGSEPVVRLLIEKGAEVNVQGGKYGNALQAAASKGHEAVVCLLIEKGADVNAQGGLYGNTLQAAACQGSERVVQLLIEKGAEVNAQGGEYGNALQAAAYQGCEPVVRLLIDLGADVNAQGGPYRNALQAAASQGSEPVVQLLIENGADVNAQGGRFGNALQGAAYQGSEPVVRLLIAKGAEVNAQGGRFGNALQAAAYPGSEPVVQLLINKGAEVNGEGGEYGNALQAASARGHLSVVHLLLANGADAGSAEPLELP